MQRARLSDVEGADVALRRLLRREGLLAPAAVRLTSAEAKATHKHHAEHAHVQFEMAPRNDPSRYHFLVGPLVDALVGVTRATVAEPKFLGAALQALGGRVLDLAARVDRMSQAVCRDDADGLSGWLFAESVEPRFASRGELVVGATRVAYSALAQLLTEIGGSLEERNVAHELLRLRAPVAVDPSAAVEFHDGCFHLPFDAELADDMIALVGGTKPRPISMASIWWSTGHMRWRVAR